MKSLIRNVVLAAAALSTRRVRDELGRREAAEPDLRPAGAARAGQAHGVEQRGSEQRQRTIAEQTQTLLKSNATLVAKVDQIEDKIQNAQGATEQTNYRLDRMTQQLTQTQHDVDELKAAAARAAAAASRTRADPTPAPAAR